MEPNLTDPSYQGMLRLLGASERFVAAWAERHSVEPFSHPCEGCGAERTTTVPFAWGVWRGLVAPLCPCGHPRPIFCVSWESMGGQ